VVSVGTTWNHSYDQHLTYNSNWIPIGTGWPFTPSNLNPTTAGATSADIGSIFERSLYPGYGAMTTSGFAGNSTYNSFTATLNRRLSHGLSMGVAYTFSKAMGTTAYTPAVSDNRAWNYGRLSFDKTHNLQINYTYEIPDVARKLGVRALSVVTGHWQLSGIISSTSGFPYNPGCGLTAGSKGITGGYTGTPDVSARCEVIGDPTANLPTSSLGEVYFNPAAYALPAIATGPNNSIVGPPVLGNQGGGAGVLSLPYETNFDATVTKNFPFGEKRVLRFQLQAYNVFNHTEVSSIGTGIQFNPVTNQVSNPASLGYATGTLPARVMAFTVRFEF